MNYRKEETPKPGRAMGSEEAHENENPDFRVDSSKHLDDADRFLLALAEDLPPEERMILCGFAGDPNVVDPNKWRPRPWRPGRERNLGHDWNGYVTVASFRRAEDNSFRRRTETFAAGRALMVDDVGTKVKRETVAGVPPSAIVETSPGNEQWWYILREPERDVARFDGVIRAFISGRLLGADPGMSGVTRVGRIPGYVNGKPVNKGWRCRLLDLSARRFTVDELLKAFDLRINGRRYVHERLHSEAALERNAAFTVFYKWLDLHGCLKRHEPDPSGWTEMTCPWVGDHTGAANTGAAIREPASENDYYGAFRCHHGHCADKGWRELTDWIDDLVVEEMGRAAQ